ncbi:Site-specific recombinase XerD [Friedmanniella luteola]|uniref:Site-specific recombinase XerD n=1 Tax=Friedmanniella luteola TaxID=546871 RepID=A0A1H1RH69_9ACTN|nr:tyrosine-type recombinase/integrase [Friedmanniella luteola]SDS34896.1 Site-specific recombinase XerD [Friedmanniella luteola]
MLGSWKLHLRAERKSPQTVKAYGDGVRAYLAWCARAERSAVIDRRQFREFVDDLLSDGARPATAVSRQLAVRRFSAWLTEEGEQASDPLLGLKAPKLDKPVVEPLSDDQLRALLKACRGPEVRDKRDEVIVRLVFTTGARAGEVVALQTGDLSLRSDPPTATIRRGKGGTGRVPLAVETAAAIDRYLRARKGHRLAGESALWVGDRGKGFTCDALHKTLAMRAQAAGIAGFHPPLLRHTAAHRWLAKGGSEGGLMAVAGWTRPDMLLRCTKAQASVRAAEEARRLNLGEL